MHHFLARRLLLLIPIFFGVSVLIFLFMNMLPGDPARILAGEGATAEDIRNITVKFGLDQPLPVQYGLFMRGVFTGDLRSLRTERPVLELIFPAFANTIQLALISILIAASLGVTMGIIAAVKRNSWIDNLVMAFSLFGVSMPVFWLGILLIILFSVTWRLLPAGGIGTFRHIILPAVTLGMATGAIIARMTRAAMLQVLNQDYIRTAQAYGLPPNQIIYKYALKNALIPIVTIVGLQFGYMLGGAVLTESVFGWPGVGRMVVDSIFSRDYTVVQTGIMIIAISFVLVNLAVDITYAFLDPRIRRR